MMRIFSLLFLPFVFVYCTPCFAELDEKQIKEGPHADVEKALPAEHPASYYLYAARLFKEDKKSDAVFWFYVGQLRYRFYLGVHPELPRDGDPAVFGSLNATVGASINEWAGGDPKDWSAQMERALKWDAENDNGFTSKTEFEKEWKQVRSGLEQLKDHVLSNEDMIRKEREKRGLPNR